MNMAVLPLPLPGDETWLDARQGRLATLPPEAMPRLSRPQFGWKANPPAPLRRGRGRTR